jgi:hypothetical protein
MFSIGKWGGFYFFHGFSTRLCLGWVAITFLPIDLDPWISLKIKKGEE